jgi:sugar phosphate isomerase/epimerase
MDAKGYSRAKSKGADITGADDDLPWADVRKALDEIGFAGWTTAEVNGGDLKRLTQVHQQMQKAFGL